MNRSALCILLLSLSFYTHGMQEEQLDHEPDPPPSLFPISTKPENRSVWDSFRRWAAKQTGTMTSDLAGLGSQEEKQRTDTILEECTRILPTGDGILSPELQKQYLDRIMAAGAKALEIIAILQAYNAEKQECDVATIIERAQALLVMHRNSTLPPMITKSLEAQLEKARTIVDKNCQISSTKSNCSD
jgi:hypothetical protein